MVRIERCSRCSQCLIVSLFSTFSDKVLLRDCIRALPRVDTAIRALPSMMAAQAPNGDEIVSPGAAGLQVLFECNGITITEAQIQGVYKERGWRSDHSLSKTDFRQPSKNKSNQNKSL